MCSCVLQEESCSNLYMPIQNDIWILYESKGLILFYAIEENLNRIKRLTARFSCQFDFQNDALNLHAKFFSI